MTTLIRRRAAAVLEVVGVYFVGAVLNDKIIMWLTDRHLISSQDPFSLLTAHTSSAELLIASRQLFVALVLIYLSFSLLILPIDCWRKRCGPGTYGLTRANRSWKALVVTGFATAALVEWPVLIHSLVDVIHPLGAMAPWRQAFFDMSWRRWQYWLFAAILSYALIPVLEELLFRGYYQRRLAEDWGDGPAIIAVACLFTFSHKQYLIANLYNVTMIASLFFLAIGLGAVFAWTRSLYPSMFAHAIINIPMTPRWQVALLVVFLVVVLFAWRGGMVAARQVFAARRLVASASLAIVMAIYAVMVHRIPAMTWIALVLLIMALVIEAIDRERNRTTQMPTAD